MVTVERTLAFAAVGLFVGFAFVSAAAGESSGSPAAFDVASYLSAMGRDAMNDPLDAPQRATALGESLLASPTSVAGALAASALATTGTPLVAPPVVAGPLANEIALAWAAEGRPMTPGERLLLERETAGLAPEVEHALAVLVAGATLSESVRGDPFSELSKEDIAFLFAHSDPGTEYALEEGERHALVDAAAASDLDAARAALVGVDMEPLLASHAIMANAVDQAAALLAGFGPSHPASPGDTFRQDTPYGEIIVTGTGNDVYPDGVEYFISVDLGGNDVYYNRAGGVEADVLGLTGTPTPPTFLPDPSWVPWAQVAYGYVHRAHNASVAIDVGGNDVYQRVEGGQGYGSMGGFGALVDLGGTDSYGGTRFVQGAGRIAGAGFLVDVAGDDDYVADRQAQGYGHDGGGGFLLDATGADDYTAQVLAQGTGFSVNLVGMLVDADGADEYRCNGELDFAESILPVNAARPGSICQASGFGGTGVLVDGTGDDVYYTFSSFKAMTLIGTGVLFDAAGNDQYLAGEWSNAVGVLGAAVLVDASGDDVYASTQHVSPWLDIYVGSNGEGYLGVGVLADAVGDDAYTSASLAGFLPQYACGSGCAYIGGTGLLLEGDGNDHYVAEVGEGGAFIGTAALVDGNGADTYELTLGGTRGQAYIETGPLIIVIVPIQPSECVYGLLYDGDGTDSYNNPTTDFGVRADEQYWGQGGDFARGIDGRGGTAAYATSARAQADVTKLVSETACEGVSGPARLLLCFQTGVCV